MNVNSSELWSYPHFSQESDPVSLAGRLLYLAFVWGAVFFGGILGMLGNIVSLIVMLRNAGERGAYCYQVGVLILDIGLLLFGIQYAVLLEGLKLRYNLPSSGTLRQNYALAAYTAHAATFLPMSVRSVANFRI